jgi:multiple sugar transport system permease protein
MGENVSGVSTARRPLRTRRWRLKLDAQEALFGYLFILPWAVGFLIFVAAAMIASLGLSLLDTDIISFTRFAGLGNYREMLQDPLFNKSLFVTSYYTFISVPLNTAFALLIALVLNQNLRGQSVWRVVYYLPAVISGVAVLRLWGWMFHPDLGLINAALEVIGIRPGPRWLYSETWAMPAIIIMSLWGSGGSMLIFLGGLQQIPQVLYEAAMIDGAGRLQRFFRITIPMLTPTIFFSLVMGFIGSYQIFNVSYILTEGGPNNATLTYVLYLYRKAFIQLRFGYASALAWALFVIVMAFTALSFRTSRWWVYYEGESG